MLFFLKRNYHLFKIQGQDFELVLSMKPTQLLWHFIYLFIYSFIYSLFYFG